MTEPSSWQMLAARRTPVVTWRQVNRAASLKHVQANKPRPMFEYKFESKCIDSARIASQTQTSHQELVYLDLTTSVQILCCFLPLPRPLPWTPTGLVCFYRASTLPQIKQEMIRNATKKLGAWKTTMHPRCQGPGFQSTREPLAIWSFPQTSAKDWVQLSLECRPSAPKKLCFL